MKKSALPPGITALLQHVFGDEEVSVTDWDLDRISVKKEDEELNIRMWDFKQTKTHTSVRWTLFRQEGDSGKEVRSGTFKASNKELAAKN